MTDKLLSIIVPGKNCEQYVVQCIESLINQSYENVEIIFIDDHSDDNTFKLAAELSKLHTQLSVFRANDTGIGNARNEGIQLANGDLITFVDADDFVHEDIYTKLVSKLEQSEADISFCDFFGYYEDSNIITMTGSDNTVTKKEFYTKNDRGRILLGVAVWNKVFRRELFNEIKFQKKLRHQDLGTIPKILFNANKIAYVQEPLYYYRRDNTSSITNTLYKDTDQKMFEIIEIYNDLIPWLKLHAGEKYKQEIDFIMLNHISSRFGMCSRQSLFTGKDNMKKFIDLYKLYAYEKPWQNTYLKKSEYSSTWKVFRWGGIVITLLVYKCVYFLKSN